jgi:1-deoxy-D-xylulose-5-phosphate reductoisomerase
MGQRITIDSASMFNKAMELIETKEFFGVPPEKIEAVIHPQVHRSRAGRFPRRGADGASGRARHAPRHRLCAALARPARPAGGAHRPCADRDAGILRPRPAPIPALGSRARSWKPAASAGCVFNAAKEIALDGFLAGRIGFMDMSGVVEATLDAMSSEFGLTIPPSTLEDVLQTDHMARKTA